MAEQERPKWEDISGKAELTLRPWYYFRPTANLSCQTLHNTQTRFNLSLNNHMLTSQIGLRTTDLKKKKNNLPPSLLSHSRFTSPPTLSSLSFPPFFPPTQTALSLKDLWVTDTALEFWELWHKDTACSPNSRRSEGVERGKKAPWVLLTWQGLEKLFRQSLSAGLWQSADTAGVLWAAGGLNTESSVSDGPVTYSELSAGI